MDGPGSETEDERAIELSTVSSIFPELVIDPDTPFSASLDLPVSPVVPLDVTFRGDGVSSHPQPSLPSANIGGKVQHGSNLLSHLPPISLRVSLPAGYPSREPPTIELSTTPPWMPLGTLQELKADGISLWENLGRDQVVFAYIDHIQQAAERGFGLGTQRPLKLSEGLMISLLDHNVKMQQENFNQQTFECGICLDPKRGSSCHRLPCSHVFCVQCLQDFYDSCIKEGDINSVRCLDPDCGKTHREATPQRTRRDGTLGPDELFRIPLEPGIVKRYVDLKRKAEVEADRGTVYCPRKWCQGIARSKKHPKPSDTPIVQETAESDEGGDDNGFIGDCTDFNEPLAVCEDCTYAFCRVCRAGWHGDFVRCLPPEMAAKRSAEDRASEEYVKRHSTPCPTCNVPCQKSMGCNHMICFRCQTHFCYLCSAWLDAKNPYGHYNNRDDGCYMRLWELEAGDGWDVEDVRGREPVPANARRDRALSGSPPPNRRRRAHDALEYEANGRNGGNETDD